MILLLKDLTIESCEKAFFGINDIEVDIVCDTRVLSKISDDYLAANECIREYLKRYFSANKLPIVLNGEQSNFNNLTLLQKIDVSYRDGSSNLIEHFDKSAVQTFMHSRRAFAIAKKMNFNDIVDLFYEYHSREWFEAFDGALGNESPFNISSDKSAKKIGKHYYIHEGTNLWNRAWLTVNKWDERWDKQLNIWQNQFYKTEQKLVEKATEGMVCLVVPEKDTIARYEGVDFTDGNMLPTLFVENLAEKLTKAKFLFPIIPLLKNKDHLRYELPDSHLSASDYWAIFKEILRKFSLIHVLDQVTVSFDFREEHGDLGSKFPDNELRKQNLTIEYTNSSDPYVVDGAFQFQTPLRDSYVKWKNDTPLINKRVLLLGDSHCSIGSSPYLTFIFSSIFSEVTFYWNSYLLNDVAGIEMSEWDIIVSEISQRFVCPNLDA